MHEAHQRDWKGRAGERGAVARKRFLKAGKKGDFHEQKRSGSSNANALFDNNTVGRVFFGTNSADIRVFHHAKLQCRNKKHFRIK